MLLAVVQLHSRRYPLIQSRLLMHIVIRFNSDKLGFRLSGLEDIMIQRRGRTRRKGTVGFYPALLVIDYIMQSRPPPVSPSHPARPRSSESQQRYRSSCG
jgi:hypothetical protein